MTPWRRTATFILWQPLFSTRGITRDGGYHYQPCLHTSPQMKAGEEAIFITSSHSITMSSSPHFPYHTIILANTRGGLHHDAEPHHQPHTPNHQAMSTTALHWAFFTLQRETIPRLHQDQKSESQARTISPEKTSQSYNTIFYGSHD